MCVYYLCEKRGCLPWLLSTLLRRKDLLNKPGHTGWQQAPKNSPSNSGVRDNELLLLLTDSSPWPCKINSRGIF